MKVKTITVRTGRTMPNPHTSYANLRTDVTLNADLSEEDDPEGCIRELQIKANAAVDTDMQRMLDAMELKARAREQDWRRPREETEEEESYEPQP